MSTVLEGFGALPNFSVFSCMFDTGAQSSWQLVAIGCGFNWQLSWCSGFYYVDVLFFVQKQHLKSRSLFICLVLAFVRRSGAAFRMSVGRNRLCSMFTIAAILLFVFGSLDLVSNTMSLCERNGEICSGNTCNGDA